MAEHGFSRDDRPEMVQVVVGVVTSYEGYPLKHWVFEGNRQDQSTVAEVVKDLATEFNIEETVFVGDRGMISRLNMDQIIGEGFDYIMGVKARQDEMAAMILEERDLFHENTNHWKEKNLTIADRRVVVRDFLMWKFARILDLNAQQRQSKAWKAIKDILAALNKDSETNLHQLREPLRQLKVTDTNTRRRLGALLRKYKGRYDATLRFVCARNPARAKSMLRRREEKLAQLSSELDQLLKGQPDDGLTRFERLLADHNRIYRRFFKWIPARNSGHGSYRINKAALENAKLYDGVFVLCTTRLDLSPRKIVASYKNLQEVEALFDDLKHFVDIHPVRHWLNRRVRSHVFLCILALLLKRVMEIDCLQSKALTETLETVAESKLVKYRVRMSERSESTRDFMKVTATTPQQAQCFEAMGIKNPQRLEEYTW